MAKHPVSSFLLVLICLLGILVSAGCGSKDQQNTDKNAPPQEVVTNQNPTAPAENNPAAVSLEKTVAGAQPEAKAESDPATKVTPAAVKEAGSYLSLQGTGMNEPMQLSLQELQSMQEALVEDSYFSLNNYGTKEYFRFKGISLWSLLKSSGVKTSATQVVITAKDGYSVTYTLADIKRDDYIDEQNPAQKYKVILAWEENGKAYDAKNYPFRFVVGQKAPGDINKPNWVSNVQSIKVD